MMGWQGDLWREDWKQRGTPRHEARCAHLAKADPIVEEITALDEHIEQLKIARRPGEKADRRAVQVAQRRREDALERLGVVLQSVPDN